MRDGDDISARLACRLILRFLRRTARGIIHHRSYNSDRPIRRFHLARKTFARIRIVPLLVICKRGPHVATRASYVRCIRAEREEREATRTHLRLLIVVSLPYPRCFTLPRSIIAENVTPVLTTSSHRKRFLLTIAPGGNLLARIYRRC